MFKIIVLLTFAISICSAYYPMSNETVGDHSEEVTDAPKYHMRIHIKLNKMSPDYALCFGALVHPNYIVAPVDHCLIKAENEGAIVTVYEARKTVDDINNGRQILINDVNCSTQYDIGVIHLIKEINGAVPIKLGILNKHIKHNRFVQIYGFNTMIEYNKDAVMKRETMITTKRKETKTCFKLEKYSIVLSSETVSTVDFGSSIIYNNGEDYLAGLITRGNEKCKNERIVLQGIELSQKQIAKELYELSSHAITFRKKFFF